VEAGASASASVAAVVCASLSWAFRTSRS
jgi:hypothetical protein